MVIMASSTARREPRALAARVRDPGFTPAVRDLGALLDLLSEEDEDLARATERAALRIESRHAARLVSETIARATGAARPARGRMTRLLGRLALAAPSESLVAARDWLVHALADADPKTRRAAARALGNL